MMPHTLKEDIKFGTLIISGMIESPLPLRKTSVMGQILGCYLKLKSELFKAEK